jgi:hypothetical protein
MDGGLFEEPIVTGGLSIGRVAVVSEPAAIRRVLMVNTDNYHKDWLQRRVLSAVLANGLLTVESDQWKPGAGAVVLTQDGAVLHRCDD